MSAMLPSAAVFVFAQCLLDVVQGGGRERERERERYTHTCMSCRSWLKFGLGILEHIN